MAKLKLSEMIMNASHGASFNVSVRESADKQFIVNFDITTRDGDQYGGETIARNKGALKRLFDEVYKIAVGDISDEIIEDEDIE